MSGVSKSKLVRNDRIITIFQRAYDDQKTVYDQLNFSPQVKKAASENKTASVGVRVCKTIVVGDVSVGKSCLVNRFCHDIFDREYKATIGVDFEVEKFSVFSTPFNLQVWDTAGQDRFRAISVSYYRSAHVVIIVFDLSEEESLLSCKKWQEEACDKADNPLIFLIGTKKDLVSESTCHQLEEKAWQIAKEMKAEYWSVSSKTGENVKEMFFRAVCLAFDKMVIKEIGNCHSEPKAIGAVKIDKENQDLYEVKKRKMPKC